MTFCMKKSVRIHNNMQLLTLLTFSLFYIFPTDGHIPFNKCLLLLTHPYSSNLSSIFFTCLSSNHIFTYTRRHIYPTNLPIPNITSLTSSFNSSQLPASNTSTTSSQISFILNPNSPSSFLKHPQYFIYLISYKHCLSIEVIEKTNQFYL